MALGDRERAFLAGNHSAAMVTVGRDGYAKPARVGIALVEDRLWSSGTEDRTRTRRLRRDPRCTLFAFDAQASWLAMESTVTILDGPDAPAHNLRLFRLMQGRPEGPLTWFGGEFGEDAFLQRMAEERRVVYQFDVHRCYGLY